MKTLENVVKMIIDSINMPNFSAYDITGLVRHHVESRKSVEKFDIKLSPPNSPHWYDVRHNDVKQIVENMLTDGDLSRVSNGSYYLYNKNQVPVVADLSHAIAIAPTPIQATVPVPPPVVAKSAPSGAKTYHSLTGYVYQYLKNKSPESVTAKQVQSAIKRKGNFKCSDIVAIKHPNIEIELEAGGVSNYLLRFV
jgi:hypothetical protein